MCFNLYVNRFVKPISFFSTILVINCKRCRERLREKRQNFLFLFIIFTLILAGEKL